MTWEPLTDLEIENALAVCRKATPGPWRVWSRPVNQVISTVVEDDNREMVFSLEGNELTEENASFIAIARNLLPRVLHELKRLRKKEGHVFFSPSAEDEYIKALAEQLRGLPPRPLTVRDKLIPVSTTDPKVWDSHEATTTAGDTWGEFPSKIEKK